MKEFALLRFHGFNAAFEDELKNTSTYVQAYEKVESFHEKTFGFRHYSSYNSFRNVRSKKIKKKRK